VRPDDKLKPRTMCEVLRSNFETLFPDIEQSIQDADFIGTADIRVLT